MMTFSDLIITHRAVVFPDVMATLCARINIQRQPQCRQLGQVPKTEQELCMAGTRLVNDLYSSTLQPHEV